MDTEGKKVGNIKEKFRTEKKIKRCTVRFVNFTVKSLAVERS